jgi:uncharacterized protein YqgV (UPF0045/DUF77 family)
MGLALLSNMGGFEEARMLVEVRIYPDGKNPASDPGVENIRRLIETSRNSFCLTPSRAWIEGDRGEIMTLLQRCHGQAHSLSIRVLATSYDGRNRQDSPVRLGTEAMLTSSA